MEFGDIVVVVRNIRGVHMGGVDFQHPVVFLIVGRTDGESTGKLLVDQMHRCITLWIGCEGDCFVS